MTAVRDRVHEAVTLAPGVHFNELVRWLNLAPGQVQYHLYRLIREDRLVREPYFGRTHYFPREIDQEDRLAIALLRRETTRAIVLSLLEYYPAEPTTLAKELDIARSTLFYHVSRLEDTGLIRKRNLPKGRVALEPTDPARLQHLLATTRTRTRDRLSDRFERLVDGMLEE